MTFSTRWKCQFSLFFLLTLSLPVLSEKTLIFAFPFSLFLLRLLSGLYQLSFRLEKWLFALFSWQPLCLPYFVFPILYPTSRVTVLMCKFDCALTLLKSLVILWIIYLIESNFLSFIFKDVHCASKFLFQLCPPSVTLLSQWNPTSATPVLWYFSVFLHVLLLLPYWILVTFQGWMLHKAFFNFPNSVYFSLLSERFMCAFV